MEAGWSEGRHYSTDDIAARLRPRGFVLFAAAHAFLERYGGLTVHSSPRQNESDTKYFHTCPEAVPADPSWAEEWERVTGTRVFPIGETTFRDYTLIIDETTRDRLIARPYQDTLVHEVVLATGEVASLARTLLRYPWRQ